MRFADSIATNEQGDKCVVTCLCGDPEHGALVLSREVVFMNGEFDSIAFVGLAAVPAGNRFSNAWRTLTNKPIRTQLKITCNDASKLGDWLSSLK